MPKPLIIDEPYPTTEGICPDAYSLRIISPAYASSESELNAILQYIYHSFFFEKQGYEDIANTLTGIAIAEMRHLDLLGATILALGAAPVYARYPATGFNFYSTKYVSYSCTLKNMLEDDIRGERHAISAYENMIKCLKNAQVKAIITRILDDEKLHLAKLEEILKDFKC
ncbi:MAG: hypothetical protein HDP34_04590 [Clostridia bacterium]|nr:hypothetical protein [Clostridia bacterium]